MKKLLSTSTFLAAAVAVASLHGAGCTTSDDPDFDGDGVADDFDNCPADVNPGQVDTDQDGMGDACEPVAGVSVTASWDVLVDDQPSACDPGIDTARIVLQPTGGGTELADLFNCEDGTGSAIDIPPGEYRLFIELTNHAGTVVNAQSLSQVIEVGSTNQTVEPPFDIHLDKGYFLLAWTLHDGSSSTTCAAEGADTVSITSTVTGGSSFADSAFDCENGVGITDPLPAGSYTISVSANNGAGASLGTAPAESNQIIDDHNQVTDLGTFDIGIGEFDD